MQQQHELSGDIAHFLQRLSHEENAARGADLPQEELLQPNTEEGADGEIQETIHVYFVREQAAAQNEVRIRESIPPGSPQKNPDLPAYAALLFGIFLPLSCLAFQLYLVFNPPTVTVTLVPRSQTVSLSGTLQLGRVMSPLTLSQSQTIPTTGKGHQSAKSAVGYITFYNGQFARVTVAAGTVLTGSGGTHIITGQDATIPQGYPPSYGQASVLSHAIYPGAAGNIPAYDLNQACCAPSVLAVNRAAFHGGQNARDFSTVGQQDIHTVATQLIPLLSQSMQAALLLQLLPREELQPLPCAPTVTSDRQLGQEATHVTVTVSETCRSVAYNREQVTTGATKLLASQALHKLGTGYSLMGTIYVSINQAAVTLTQHPLVFLSYTAAGTWVYALSQETTEQIKSRIAGKTTQEAVRLFASLPGIAHAAIRWHGFGDAARLPKNTGYIHIALLIM